MKGLVIGKGQIGNAVADILGEPAIDKGEEAEGLFDILHICFPFSGEFEQEVRKYQEKYQPKYTIIHSTVPVGTSKKLDAVHSPVIGLHPFLREGIATFKKFLGGEKAEEVADYFRRKGLKVYIFEKAEITELLKLMSTTHYALEVEWAKEVKKMCRKFKVPFSAWTLWVENYNKGYEELGYPEYKKPSLVPISQKIGGHCLLPNAKVLFQQTKSKIIKLILKRNYEK